MRVYTNIIIIAHVLQLGIPKGGQGPFNVDVLFIPVHMKHGHWVLGVVNFKELKLM